MAKVDLGPHFDSFIQEKVASGHFKDAGDVIRAGLRLLEEQDDRVESLAEIRDLIAAAYDDPRPSLSADAVLDHVLRKPRPAA